jgi:peptidyl-prolyl cis-trans isomerase A (cyclophilin A)
VQYSRNWILGLLGLSLLAVGCKKGDTSQPTAATEGNAAAANTAGNPAPATPKVEQDPLHPVVTIETSLGAFKVRLDAEKAPITVNNFLDYVAAHHYDQTIFHQVLGGKEYPRVVIGGAFTADLVEKKAGVPIRNEAHNGLKNRKGTIGMARQPDAIDSATCHFYVNLADNAVLDHKDRTAEKYGYCVFGEVVEGFDVIEQIGQVPVRDADKFDRLPAQTVAIKTARRIK